MQDSIRLAAFDWLSKQISIHGDDVDLPDKEGNWMYKYRGTDRHHRDNVGLRELLKRQIPLIYFIGIRPGRYWAVFPVFIMGGGGAA